MVTEDSLLETYGTGDSKNEEQRTWIHTLSKSLAFLSMLNILEKAEKAGLRWKQNMSQIDPTEL